MKKKGKFTIVFAALTLLFSGTVYTGNLDQAASPTSAGGGAMYTLEDIYNRLLNGTTATKRVGPFTEPGAGPAATGHTLDDVYNLIGNRAFVPKTGQTGCWNASGASIGCTGTGQDGEKLKGATWPSPRFTDNSNGTVTDNLTGLIWLKNANCFGTRNWTTALSDCNTLASGACGLTDGSAAGQWRLPNRFEMESLLDLSKFNRALPTGHPFSGVQGNWYWTSTTFADGTSNAWGVSLFDGLVNGHNKTFTRYVWPVRGGQ